MKVSEQWLREWVNPALDTQELVAQITMAGLEVDGVESLGGDCSGVVVGEVRAVNPHPDAEKLRICEVFDGEQSYQVVCGAPNVEPGMRVPFAQVGAKLPGGLKIKRAKLRGVESLGMLCSEQELGLAEESDGLMPLPADAPLGTDIVTYLGLNDSVIDIDLTPNRSDCLSVAGLARELGVLNRMPVNAPDIQPVAARIPDRFEIRVEAPAACPRYIGRVIRGVDLSRPSPLWMQERLRRSGMRSIDPVVDVTNYVMLELGQPLHAFDLDQLKGGIVVRMAKLGEQITLLDGETVELKDNTLLIADHEKPLAMAGIMGGEHSGVTENTRDILLESAFFAPLAITGRARQYGLHTESSHRFERGVDYQLQRKAAERATQLLLEIVGGEPGELIEVVAEQELPAAELVTLRHQRAEELLGMEFTREEVEDILTRLGLTLEESTEAGWTWRAPSYRFDIEREVDLIEELGRIRGYNNLPVTKPKVSLEFQAVPEIRHSWEEFKAHLVARGYQEAITYSFVDPQLQKALFPEVDGIALANPISADLSVMRVSLLPGLVNALRYNQNRQQSRVRLFETGLRFLKEGDNISQEPMLAGLIAGTRDPENWADKSTPLDFYDAKGDVESLLARVGADFSFKPGTHPAMHPGQCARIERNGELVGFVGALHPALLNSLNLNGPVFIFELCLALVTEGKLPSFKGFSKYPGTRRDLAVVVDKQVLFAEIEAQVRKVAGQWLTQVRLFDVYEGAHIEDGKKSVALGLVWQHPERTLQEEEITSAFEAVIRELEKEFGALLRS